MKGIQLFTEKRKNFPHTSGIYLIYSEVNDGYYVGSSVDLQNRLCDHKKCLKNNYHDNPKLQNAYNKYGPKVFKYKILYQYDHFVQYGSDEYLYDLLVKEKSFIELYSKNHYMYNIILDPTISISAVKKQVVYQYDKDGNFIKQWESANYVKRVLGFQINTALTLNIKAGGFFWRKEFQPNQIYHTYRMLKQGKVPNLKKK